MNEQTTTPLDKQSYQLEVTRPVWLPYNDIAHDLVAAWLTSLATPPQALKQNDMLLF